MSALGFQVTTGGDIEAFVKYDAKAGRWFRIDRSQDAGGNWITTPVDITNNATFVIDLANIQVGWIDFTPQGPNMAMAPVGQKQPEQPSAKHRAGFKTYLFSERNLGGKRVWSHNAKCVLTAIDELYVQYKAAPEAAQGLLPVVTMASSKPVTTPAKGQNPASTNYAPVFQIVQWVDRPAALGATVTPITASQAPAAPTQPIQGHTPLDSAAMGSGGPLF